MNADRQKAKEIFAAGLEIDPVNRGSFLDEACGKDDELRRDVESLLASDLAAEGFMAETAIGEVADLLAPSERFEKGRSFGQYEIIELIGAGGMGEVYLARDTRLNRQVALKFLSFAVSGDANRFRRFEREALAVSALNHPNILTIYELRTDDQIPFIATEFVKGETLAKRSKRGDLDLNEVLTIAEQTAFALATAHEAGIIHRDIKPDNIMLRDDGIVKVLDFGLAKLIGNGLLIEEVDALGAKPSTLANTNSSGVLGTVAYMSPEQARGRTDIDSRTDIWSLGIVIYEMLTGVTPFTGETSSDVINGIVKSDPAPISSIVEGVPLELEQIVDKTLRKDPAERYQNSKDLLDDIRGLKADLNFRSKLENDPQIRLKLNRSMASHAKGETSPILSTRAISSFNQTDDQNVRSTWKRKAAAPFRPLLQVTAYARLALITLIAASVVVGAAYLRSALTKKDVYTVDTTANDHSLTACTSAPNDCSIVGAVLNANTDGYPDTIDFDPTVFDSHKTIELSEGFGLQPDGKLTINGPAAGVTLSLINNKFSAEVQGQRVTRLFGLYEPNMALEIRNLRLSGGSSFQGGGIYSERGTVTVMDSVITGNSSTEAGGGITNRNGNMTIINSTVSNNSSLTGGGIANINGTMTLINTLVSDNKAPLGGGIRNERGTLSLINSTVSGNSANSGGGLFNFNGTTNLYNTIIANSRSGGDCHLYNDTINAEYSLIEDGLSCINGRNANNFTGDPLLGSLTDNGGLNVTLTLLPGSIAIDAGSISLALDPAGEPLATDRRGTGSRRVAGRSVDLGAFESEPQTE